MSIFGGAYWGMNPHGIFGGAYWSGIFKGGLFQ